MGGLRFGTDGDGNYGYYGADDSLIPFKGAVPDNYLFKEGDLCYKTSGGWEGSATGTLYFADKIYCKAESGGNTGHSMSVRNRTAIDMTPYTRLCIKGDITSSGQYVTNFSYNMYNSNNLSLSVQKITDETIDADIIFDISNINVPAYFKISGNHVYSGNYILVDIAEIWLQ